MNLLGALFLLCAFVVGVATFTVGWWRRSANVRGVGAALCASVVIVVVSDVYYDSAIEWNPTIAADSQITGTWTGDDQTITLAANHTFLFRNIRQTAHGTWNRDDYNLYLHADTYSGTMRFIQFHSSYRLMTDPPEDPDMWDKDLGLRLIRRR